MNYRRNRRWHLLLQTTCWMDNASVFNAETRVYFLNACAETLLSVVKYGPWTGTLLLR